MNFQFKKNKILKKIKLKNFSLKNLSNNNNNNTSTYVSKNAAQGNRLDLVIKELNNEEEEDDDKNENKIIQKHNYKEFISTINGHKKFINSIQEIFDYEYIISIEELNEKYSLQDWYKIKEISRLGNLGTTSIDISENSKKNLSEIKNKYEIANKNNILPVTCKKTNKKHVGMFYPTTEVIKFYANSSNSYFFISPAIVNYIWATDSLQFLEQENINLKNKYVSDRTLLKQLLNFIEYKGLSDLKFYQQDDVNFVVRGVKNQQNIIFTTTMTLDNGRSLIESILLAIGKDIKDQSPTLVGTIRESITQNSTDKRSFRVRLANQSRGNNMVAMTPRGVAIRLLPSSSMIESINNLGFYDDHIDIFKEAINSKNGLIIACGATGRGKTTWLFSILKYMHSIMNKDIVVLHKDTKEIEVDGFWQIELDDESVNGLSMQEAISATLQMKPDVTLIDEVKKSQEIAELVDIANRAHTTFTTMHTNDTPSALGVIENVGKVPKAFYVHTLKLIVNFDLAKKICTECSGTGAELIKINNSQVKKRIGEEKFKNLTQDKLDSIKEEMSNEFLNNFKNEHKKVQDDLIKKRCQYCDGSGIGGMIPVIEMAYFIDVNSDEDPLNNFFKLVEEKKILFVSKEEVAKRHYENGFITKDEYLTFTSYSKNKIKDMFETTKQKNGFSLKNSEEEEF